MEIQKLATRSVVFKYTLPEWDLNLHLILGRRNNYLIDTGLSSQSVAPIQEYLGNNCKPLVVVNTHHHWDHVWGNHCFDDCCIISHTRCRELLTAGYWAGTLKKNVAYIRGDVKVCLPNLVFDDSLYFPDDGIRIFYTPGHTVDCISVYDEQDKVLNAGDNVGDTMREIVPEIETGGDIYIASLHKYKALDFTACVSGHNAILGHEVFDKIEDALKDQYINKDINA